MSPRKLRRRWLQIGVLFAALGVYIALDRHRAHGPQIIDAEEKFDDGFLLPGARHALLRTEVGAWSDLDLATREFTAAWPDLSFVNRDVAASPDGSELAALHYDNPGDHTADLTLIARRENHGRVLKPRDPLATFHRAPRFSPDGRLVAAIYYHDYKYYPPLPSPPNATPTPRNITPAPAPFVWRERAVGVQVWDRASGRALYDMHSASSPTDVFFSPDSRRLCVTSMRAMETAELIRTPGIQDDVTIHDARDGRELCRWQVAHGYLDRYDATGRTFIQQSGNNVGRCDAATGNLLWWSRLPPNDLFAPRGIIAVSSDDRYLACARSGNDGQTVSSIIVLLDAGQGAVLRTIDWNQTITSLEFSADNAHLTALSPTGSAATWPIP